MDILAWAYEQEEEKREGLETLLNEQRKIWAPPRSVFNKCCVKWLADGDADDSEYFDPDDVRGGCIGTSQCRRVHPTILVKFQDGKTLATVEHLLRPFTKYFQHRCKQGTATQVDSNTWQLEGYMRANLNDLENQKLFGSRFVKVEPGALETSDEAHRKEQEEGQERASKRIKHSHPTPPDLLASALEICHQKGFLEGYLDCVEIAWLRTLSKATQNVGAQLAKNALLQQHKRLSYLAFVDGKRSYSINIFQYLSCCPADLMEDFDSGDQNVDDYDDEDRVAPSAVVYKKSRDAPSPLLNASIAVSSKNEATAVDDRPDSFLPSREENSQADSSVAVPLISWDSGLLNKDDCGCDKYKGHKICVYREQSKELSEQKESESNGNDREGVAQFHFSPETHLKKEGSVALKSSTKGMDARLVIRVLETNIEEQRASNRGSGKKKKKSKKAATVRYSGKFRVERLEFGFASLAAHEARIKYQAALKNAEETEKVRPLMEQEKKYLKEIQAMINED